MATGRERRAERLNERLRGAQRANVNDESFSIDIGGLDIPGSTSPAAAQETPSAAPESSVVRPPRTSNRIASSTMKRLTQLDLADPYDMPNTSSKGSSALDVTGSKQADTRMEGNPADEVPEEDTAMEEATPMANGSDSKMGGNSTARRSVRTAQSTNDVEMLSAPSTAQTATQVVSPIFMEEVGESPAHAPGSGRRRRVPLSDVMSSATRLANAISPEDAEEAVSSPLVSRAKRRSDTGPVPSRLSAASVSLLQPDHADESSPRRPQDTSIAGEDELSDDGSVGELTHEVGSKTVADPELEVQQTEQLEREARDLDYAGGMEEEVGGDTESDAGGQEIEDLEPELPSPGAAQEVDNIETAKVLGKKRAMQRQASPELGSEAVEAPVEEPEQQPQPKRKRLRPGKSPATQKQPAVKPRPGKIRAPRMQPVEEEGEGGELVSAPPPEVETNEQDKPKRRKKTTRRISDQSELSAGGGGDVAIEITVQRFINNRKRAAAAAADDDADPLHSEIPFVNSNGESVVDVFAQICNEVIASTLAQFRDIAINGEDVAKKKEFRIKVRAVEAYREELNSRFLQHAIHLNHWHSLRKRVRHVQKEKLALREEIIRIRGEREQVALRMDAVRIKHEADTKDFKHCLDASTIMHDIDLVTGQGEDAPELPKKQQKEAELANLELLVSRIAEEASSSSSTGGMLSKIKDFNAFLERAAIALESR